MPPERPLSPPLPAARCTPDWPRSLWLGRATRSLLPRIRLRAEREHPHERHLESNPRIRRQMQIPATDDRSLVEKLDVLGREHLRQPLEQLGRIELVAFVIAHHLFRGDACQQRCELIEHLRVIRRPLLQRACVVS